MIKIDFTQPSTWRGAAKFVAGAIAMGLIAPQIFAIIFATDAAEVQLAVTKSLAFGTVSLAMGQISSGLIGFLFDDNQKP